MKIKKKARKKKPTKKQSTQRGSGFRKGFENVRRFKTREEVDNLFDHGITQEAEGFIASHLGIPSIQKPGEEPPDMPEDVTELDNDALVDLHTQMRQWESFLDEQVTTARTLLNEIEFRMHGLGAEIRKGVSGSAAQKADVRDTDPVFALFARRKFQQVALVDQLDMRRRRFERYASALSRVITMRSNAKD